MKRLLSVALNGFSGLLSKPWDCTQARSASEGGPYPVAGAPGLCAGPFVYTKWSAYRLVLGLLAGLALASTACTRDPSRDLGAGRTGRRIRRAGPQGQGGAARIRG